MSTSEAVFELFLEFVGLTENYNEAQQVLNAFQNNTDKAWNDSAWFYHVRSQGKPDNYDYERHMLKIIDQTRKLFGAISPQLVQEHCAKLVREWWLQHEGAEPNQTPLCLVIWDDAYVLLERDKFFQEQSS